MKLSRKLLAVCSLVLAVGFGVAALCGLPSTAAKAAAEFTVKTYVPAAGDFIDYWGGVSDIPSAEGGGARTFAHAAFNVPLKGTEIELTTSFMLYSKRTEEEGGDDIDAWCTYSFSANPGGDSDKTFPSLDGSTVDGYSLHITNYSSTNSPNCVEVQVVEFTDGGQSHNTLKTFFLDNACTKVGSEEPLKFVLSLTKVDDYDYTLMFTKVDGTVLKKVSNLELDDDLFIDDDGQTYFGTALYEKKDACDGSHWNHRGVSLYSVEAYTKSAAGAEVTLSESRYVFEEGTTYKPAVTVKVNGTALTANKDYYVRYADNKQIGTGKVIIEFMNDYAGNESVTKEFTIADPNAPSDENGTNNGTNDSEKKGCKDFALGSSAAAVLLSLGLASALLIKKRAR